MPAPFTLEGLERVAKHRRVALAEHLTHRLECSSVVSEIIFPHRRCVVSDAGVALFLDVDGALADEAGVGRLKEIRAKKKGAMEGVDHGTDGGGDEEVMGDRIAGVSDRVDGEGLKLGEHHRGNTRKGRGGIKEGRETGSRSSGHSPREGDNRA